MFKRFYSHPLSKSKHWLKWTLVVLVIFLALLGVFAGVVFSYQKIYQDRVFPGVYAGKYHLGGMTSAEVKEFLESFNNRLAKEGIDFGFQYDGRYKTINLAVVPAGDASIELIKLNSGALALNAVNAGHVGTLWQRFYLPIYYRFYNPRQLEVNVDIRSEFSDNLREQLFSFTDQPTDAKLVVSSVSPLQYDILPEKGGSVFDYNQAIDQLEENLKSLSLIEIKIEKEEFSPQIFKEDVQSAIERLSEIFPYGNLSLSYIDAKTKIRRDWSITPEIYREWIQIRKNQEDIIIFVLDKVEVYKYLFGLKPLVEQPALDAKFEMDNNKVNKFQASQNGIMIDVEKTFSDLDSAFQERNFKPIQITKTVNVSVEVVKPKVEMVDANDLGISQILGVGVSAFKDSHTNRIKNIGNAVTRLNGTLIKPGEIFSTNKYAGPYTRENGYLEEEVIVGKKIKKEVGGGMCQIGTTAFRMAMNSGMPIQERYNHSLVVSYYADPVNGNPGTDATVYEPYVDFKFVNDTGGYLLLQTDINYDKQELSFTLWGKDDGRNGSYTHPVVSEWFAPGETEETKTITLKPGEKSCQSAFTGAKASFMYTRFTSSSEKIERIFESYYRPLPQICMIGVDQVEFCEGDGKGSEECANYEPTSSTAKQD
ncbi:MAG: VanW family protein [bacterium]